MTNGSRNLVQSVSRSLRILEALGNSEKPRSLAEISTAVGLPKTTVHRLLQTLEHEGYVEQDGATRQIRLSAKVLDLAASYLGSLDLRDLARPVLTDLWQRSNETVHLGLHEAGEVLYIEKLVSPQTIRMYSRVGRRAPLHCTGLGKAILAHLPAAEVQEILQRHGLRRYTENTLVEPDQLQAELARIRAEGAAFDDEEHEHNVRCVASPVYDAQGQVIGAISIAGPAFRLTHERLQEMKPWVVDAAQRVSRWLGYSPAASTTPGATPSEEAALAAR